MKKSTNGAEQTYKTLDEIIGNTPLIRLRNTDTGTNILLLKLEGHNPAGSVKDRPAKSMIEGAEKKGRIKPGDVLIEPTSGNTGIALAMIAAIKGYRMILVMPESASEERKAVMRAYGARLIETSPDGGMEEAIDTAKIMEKEGKGVILDQFGNHDNPKSHYSGTGPEIWNATGGTISHFVSAMGTTGTIMGTGKYLKEKNSGILIIGAQPAEGSKIPGIRKWPEEYLPAIYRPDQVDRIITVNQKEAEDEARRLAAEEGLFCGISSGGNVAAARKVCTEIEHGCIVAVICDRGDRYLSTGVF